MSRASKRPNRSETVRTPVGRRNVLVAPSKKGFERRFVNDEPGRVQMFLDAGYTIVNDGSQAGDPNVGVASALGSNTEKPVGGGKNAVLMEIKEDWYKEDQAAKQTRLKQKEKGILRDANKEKLDLSNVYGDGLDIKSDPLAVRTE